MRRFHQAGEFRGWQQRYVAGSSPADDYGVLLVDNFVKNARQVLTQTRIGCFPGHQPYCTGFLYGLESV